MPRKPMAALLRELSSSSSRRLLRPVLAAAVLISAAAVLFSFSAPQRLAFSSSSAAVSIDELRTPPPPAIAPSIPPEASIFPPPPPPAAAAAVYFAPPPGTPAAKSDGGAELDPPPPPPAAAATLGFPPPPGTPAAKSDGGAEWDPSPPPPPPPAVPRLLTTPDRELLYAKGEIERAPVVVDDPELHAPLFRNVSVFKRSYELMEETLKVYIYRDGAKPIFHQPDLKGIYASEGWFMKLMEGSKKFAVKNPNRAHLFYLPYGARQLELALYVPGSHNLKPLLLHMKNYVNMISAKYPFWNRTRGSDHFFVACHDWGPYTTQWHDELRKNAIKALCNADVSEGIFVRGKDVSLPETSIRTARHPYKDLGGKPASQRSILAFFAGNMHGRVRPILLQHWEGKDEDMKIYGPLPSRIARKMSYVQHMKSSKYCICPMGYEVNSPRIAEAIYYECVPVIIADNFVPPFDEVLDWSAFSLTVAEKDIPELKNILMGVSLRRYVSMQLNVKRLQKHFLWHARPVKYDIFHMILHSIWFNRLHQIQAEL